MSDEDSSSNESVDDNISLLSANVDGSEHVPQEFCKARVP